MHTMVDFITHVKGVEYILSISFIAGFLILWEVLKPAPFRTAAAVGKEDLGHMRQMGFEGIAKTAGKLVSAPFIGLAYLLMLPLGFAAMLVLGVFNGAVKIMNSILGAIGSGMSFEWRPLEAYFTGKKGGKKTAAKAEHAEK